MGFADNIAEKNFVILCETDPPKGTDTDEFLKTAEMLKGRVHGLLVTDMPGAVMRMGAVAASSILKENGSEVICNFSCRDRNVLALQADILSASAFGLKNIYVTNGVEINLGDHPAARPVKEVNDTELLSIVKRLNKGFDYNGNEITGRPDFFAGIYINSGAKSHALDLEFKNLEDKIKLDAAFAVTSAVFDIKQFEGFVKKLRNSYTIPVIAEIILLKSIATAKFINKHVDDVMVPDSIIDRLYDAGDKQAEGISIAVDLIRELKGMCQGVKIVPLGWEAKIPAIINELNV